MSEPGVRPLNAALRRWFAPTGLKRILFFVAADLVVVVLAMVAAFELRFDGRIPQRYWHSIPIYILLAIGPIVFANSMFRLYNITWRFVGARDVVNVCTATFVGTAAWGLASPPTTAIFLRPGGRLGKPSLRVQSVIA